MADDTLIADDAATTTTDATVDTTVADTTDTATTTDAATDTTTDDWRSRLAGDDQKLLGYLARVPSEKALVEQLKRHNDDIKAGKYLKPLPENPTPEEMAAWRKQNGVPDAPADYKLPEGLVIGDADKPFVDEFLTKMHGVNASPAVTGAALEAYYDIVEEQTAARSEAARQAESGAIETLREEWGGDYKRNLNVMHGYLDTLPEDVATVFRQGVGPDGVPIGYNPAVLRWLTERAMEDNPVATVVPGAGANQASAIADEIAKIETMMRTDRAAYNKDQKVQERYRELITAREKLSK